MQTTEAGGLYLAAGEAGEDPQPTQKINMRKKHQCKKATSFESLLQASETNTAAWYKCLGDSGPMKENQSAWLSGTYLGPYVL